MLWANLVLALTLQTVAGVQSDFEQHMSVEADGAVPSFFQESLLRREEYLYPVKPSLLVDCANFTKVASCPKTYLVDECDNKYIERNGIRYICFFQETISGGEGITMKASHCNVDMHSKVCRQLGGG
mmetsp:Transcript_60144/g.106956  ORF Transcript_60144/g.106956 Transcript_60144/m.106956 type:complete len:127 (-) Transcript_60144:52-432(-)